MPRIIEKTVYKFAELSESAKERAREWFKAGDDFDFAAEHILEDAEIIAGLFGLHFDHRQVPLMNGKTRGEPCVYYSGFCSQGDGASFTGGYMYSPGAAKKVKEYAPLDTELHSIVDRLSAVQKSNFYSLRATISTSGRYSHSGTMRASVSRFGEEVNAGTDEEVLDLLREFADWIYSRLNKEYDYTQSDEYVDEAITANAYEFTEEGGRPACR